MAQGVLLTQGVTVFSAWTSGPLVLAQKQRLVLLPAAVSDLCPDLGSMVLVAVCMAGMG